jgi:hypothetical protein
MRRDCGVYSLGWGIPVMHTRWNDSLQGTILEFGARKMNSKL